MEEEIIELEHTADIGFIVRSKDLEGLIKKTALLLANIMIEEKTVEEKETKTVEIVISDKELIIIDVLRELLYFFETENFIWKDVHVSIKDNKVILNLKGEKLNFQKHKFKKDVKAITYHDYYLKNKGNYFETRFILDI